MTNAEKKQMVVVAMILTTVHEVGDWSPLSPITTAMEAHDIQLESSLALLRGLQSVGFLTMTAETLTLTPKGIEAAVKLAAVGL
jgi:hypothetical protein